MKHFWLKDPLFDAAGDGGAGGGGAGAGNPGITKDDVTAIVTSMFNGMDKRYLKQFKDLETSLKGLDGISKAFGSVKPKKLAKLLAKASGKKSKGNADDEEEGDGSGNNGGGGNDSNNNREDVNNRGNNKKQLEDPFKKRQEGRGQFLNRQ
jgi:hypothetical protein